MYHNNHVLKIRIPKVYTAVSVSYKNNSLLNVSNHLRRL